MRYALHPKKKAVKEGVIRVSPVAIHTIVPKCEPLMKQIAIKRSDA